VEWGEAMMARLFMGEAGEVVKGLKEMEARSEEAKRAIEGLWGVFRGEPGAGGVGELSERGLSVGEWRDRVGASFYRASAAEAERGLVVCREEQWDVGAALREV
jgi:hypothetical protein